MAKSVFTGWRVVTPGSCFNCGFDDNYGCDGRGNVACSCSLDEDDDSFDFTPADSDDESE